MPEERAAAVLPALQHVLDCLAQRPGFERGQVARALDDPRLVALLTEWDSVGSYRRGLSAYDVKLATAPLMPFALDEPGAFEVLAASEQPAGPSTPPSQRAR